MAELWSDILYTDVMQSDGYIVDYAILTTYSLDMPSLLAVPFALGTMNELDEAAFRSPHLILEAVNRAVDKFVVFCNAGCIAVPQRDSKLYTLLEHSVVQITLEAKGHGFVNFHPKVWVVKETNPDSGESQIKVVVLSRNLTGSNDLDVVCELVGKIRSKPASNKAQQKHAPLMDFLKWLGKRSARRISKNIDYIIDDIQYINSFELDGSPFEDYDFFPMGIDGYNGIEQCLEREMLDGAGDIVVISPFVDMKTMQMMTRCNHRSRKTLIARYSSIDNEMLSLFGDGVYVPKEVLTDRVEKDIAVDLHEKVYFIHNNHTGNNQLYLGSTNATQNGFDRNVEFLLRLTFERYQCSYDKFRKELINDGKDCMFERITAVSPDNTAKEDSSDELYLRKVISAIKQAEIQEKDNSYTVIISCYSSKMQNDIDSFIYPLGCDNLKRKLTPNGVLFDGLDLPMLTEFYVIKVGEVERVVKIETKGMPTEARDKAIFRSIIDTKGKFINYLAFMLTDNVEQYIVESHELEKERPIGGYNTTDQEISISLYEDMVRMAYTDPSRISSIKSLMDQASDDVIPEHFKEMYATFEKALNKIYRL